MTPAQVEAAEKCGRISTAFKQMMDELKRHGIACDSHRHDHRKYVFSDYDMQCGRPPSLAHCHELEDCEHGRLPAHIINAVC